MNKSALAQVFQLSLCAPVGFAPICKILVSLEASIIHIPYGESSGMVLLMEYKADKGIQVCEKQLDGLMWNFEKELFPVGVGRCCYLLKAMGQGRQ